MVARTGLLDRIATVEPPVISVIAPTGYGKTTLLAQWVERAAPRAAWVTADERDNDPDGPAQHGGGRPRPDRPPSAAVLEALEARRPVHTVMARLHPWVAGDREPFTLAIDHADAMTNPEAFDIVTQIAMQLPEQHRLLVASRAPPELAGTADAGAGSPLRARRQRPGARSEGGRRAPPPQRCRAAPDRRRGADRSNGGLGGRACTSRRSRCRRARRTDRPSRRTEAIRTSRSTSAPRCSTSCPARRWSSSFAPRSSIG